MNHDFHPGRGEHVPRSSSLWPSSAGSWGALRLAILCRAMGAMAGRLPRRQRPEVRAVLAGLAGKCFWGSTPKV